MPPANRIIHRYRSMYGGEDVDKEGETFMRVSAMLREDEMKKVRAMQKYVDEIRAQAQKKPDVARIEACEALVRTGVITRKGNPKKVIVSWE